jgi:hypothetical protein
MILQESKEEDSAAEKSDNIDQQPEASSVTYRHLSASNEPQYSMDPTPRANTLHCSTTFLTQFPQPSCSRDVDIHHPHTCTLTVASEAVSPLTKATYEKKRARSKRHSKVLIGTPQKKNLKHRNRKTIEKKK